MDRGLLKLIALPFFGCLFRNVLEDLTLCTVEKIVGFPADNGAQFASKVMEWAPILMKDVPAPVLEAALVRLAESFDQLDLFWHLVQASKDLLLLQEARMQGLGGFMFRGPTPAKHQI